MSLPDNSHDVDLEMDRFRHVVDEFAERVGAEPQDVIRRLTASVERSLMAERMRGRFDVRRLRR